MCPRQASRLLLGYRSWYISLVAVKEKNGEYRAKLFRNGRSQAIRLPKELRFDEQEKEVRIRRAGNCLIVESLDEWPDDFWKLFGGVPDLETPTRRPLKQARDRFNR